MDKLAELVRTRKSVRSFDGAPLRAEDREKLAAELSRLETPFDLPMEFRILDGKEHRLSSPVVTGTDLYAAGKLKRGALAEVAYGFAFERFILYAWSLGVGTVWIAGTMDRPAFEGAMELADDELLPAVTPLGYPAKKRSIRETMMRKGVGADTRLPGDRLFFDGAWDVPLPADKQAPVADLIEMVRWAPSAVNKQPWRIVVSGGAFHFYERKDRGYVSEKTGDLQKIDVGIALCHFVMGLEERGEKPAVTFGDPGLSVPQGAEYVATVTRGA